MIFHGYNTSDTMPYGGRGVRGRTLACCAWWRMTLRRA